MRSDRRAAAARANRAAWQVKVEHTSGSRDVQLRWRHTRLKRTASLDKKLSTDEKRPLYELGAAAVLNDEYANALVLIRSESSAVAVRKGLRNPRLRVLATSRLTMVLCCSDVENARPSLIGTPSSPPLGDTRRSSVATQRNDGLGSSPCYQIAHRRTEARCMRTHTRRVICPAGAPRLQSTDADREVGTSQPRALLKYRVVGVQPRRKVHGSDSWLLHSRRAF